MASKQTIHRNPIGVPVRTDAFGDQSLIARVLGVSRFAVCREWRGERVSARIRTEIQRYLKNPAAYRRRHAKAA